MSNESKSRFVCGLSINKFSSVEEIIERQGKRIIGLRVNPIDRRWSILIAGYEGWNYYSDKSVQKGTVDVEVAEDRTRGPKGLR